MGHGHDRGCGGELNTARAERAHVRALVGDRAQPHAQRLGAPWANVSALRAAFGAHAGLEPGHATTGPRRRGGTLRIRESVPARRDQPAAFAMRTAFWDGASRRICPGCSPGECSRMARLAEPNSAATFGWRPTVCGKARPRNRAGFFHIWPIGWAFCQRRREPRSALPPGPRTVAAGLWPPRGEKRALRNRERQRRPVAGLAPPSMPIAVPTPLTAADKALRRPQRGRRDRTAPDSPRATSARGGSARQRLRRARTQARWEVNIEARSWP